MMGAKKRGAGLRALEGCAPLPPAEVQQLWFSLVQRDWSSLVLVPSHRAGSGAELAQELARIGEQHQHRPLRVIDARGAELKAVASIVAEMKSQSAEKHHVLVVIDAVVRNQAGIPIALAADAALLCVTLGEADTESARRTVEMVGKARFVGAVTLPGHDE